VATFHILLRTIESLAEVKKPSFRGDHSTELFDAWLSAKNFKMPHVQNQIVREIVDRARGQAGAGLDSPSIQVPRNFFKQANQQSKIYRLVIFLASCPETMYEVDVTHFTSEAFKEVHSKLCLRWNHLHGAILRKDMAEVARRAKRQYEEMMPQQEKQQDFYVDV
jgi:hypothetical protein